MASIMVAGSAEGNLLQQEDLAREIGREIARAGATLINGATTGLPEAAAFGALSEGGRVIGVSPGIDFDDHLTVFEFPPYEGAELIFTGIEAQLTWTKHILPRLGHLSPAEIREQLKQFRLKFRNNISVAMADGVIAVGGRTGTLNELTIAADLGKVIGVLQGSGGAAEKFPAFLKGSGKMKNFVFEDSVPNLLVLQVLGMCS